MQGILALIGKIRINMGQRLNMQQDSQTQKNL